MTTPAWTRPDDLRSRSRRWTPWMGGAIALGLSLSIGMLLAGEPARPTTIVAVPVVAPVTVTPPPAPAPVVHVHVPPPSPAPVVAPEPVFRMAAPMLDPECIGRPTQSAAACAWDAGFPAISADGSLMVEAYEPDDGPRGNPGLTMVLVDVATSKIVRSIPILDPGEYDPQNAYDEKHRAKIRRRIAAAQRVLDERRFRTLVALGRGSALADGGGEDRKHVYAEFDGNAMRLIDPATQTILWRHRFEAPRPPGPVNVESECHSWRFANVHAWWDATSRTVLARLVYHHGGCMCGSSSIAQVFRIR